MRPSGAPANRDILVEGLALRSDRGIREPIRARAGGGIRGFDYARRRVESGGLDVVEDRSKSIGATMSDLLDWLDANSGALRETLLGSLRERLHSRALVDEWWHAGDVETAYEFAARRLAELRLNPPTAEEFTERHEFVQAHVEDEEQERRHQIGFVATQANAQLRDGPRFHCLGPELAWENEEPPWVLLDDEEYARLLAIGGPPPSLESAYSGRTAAPRELGPRGPDLSLIAPHTAELKANEALSKGRPEEALLYLAKASEEGDSGLLVRLQRIDVLRMVHRQEEARALWSQTADEWLSGTRRVWDTQWRTLLKLHGRLRLAEDDPRVGQIRARA
jgi:hypothetical protein